METLQILKREIEQRISILENDNLICKSKKAILIKENTKFLVRVQQLLLPYLNK